MFSNGDVGGVGNWVLQQTGVDLFAARAATDHWAMWAGCVVSVGLMNAVGG
ncbi:MAG: hypothetical protein RI920_1738, partial [Pseudomonadota bacterium]